MTTLSDSIWLVMSINALFPLREVNEIKTFSVGIALEGAVVNHMTCGSQLKVYYYATCGKCQKVVLQ